MKSLIFSFLLISTVYGKLNVLIQNEKFDSEKLLKLDRSIRKPENKLDLERNIVDDKIIAYLESAREKFGEGFNESGIPPLDPFTLENVNIKIDQKPIVKADFNLSNVAVVGLQDFVIQTVHFRIIGLSFEYAFVVPKLVYTSEFSINGKAAGVVPLNTKGEARLQANGFLIAGNATLGTTSDGYLLLKTLLVDFDIDETEVEITGPFGEGFINNVINWVFNQLSDDFFQGQRDRLNEFVSEILFKILGDAIGNINLADLIG